MMGLMKHQKNSIELLRILLKRSIMFVSTLPSSIRLQSQNCIFWKLTWFYDLILPLSWSNHSEQASGCWLNNDGYRENESLPGLLFFVASFHYLWKLPENWLIGFPLLRKTLSSPSFFSTCLRHSSTSGYMGTILESLFLVFSPGSLIKPFW